MLSSDGERQVIMPGILVRGLKAETIKRLKDRARRNGRSLQSEAKLLLEQSAGSEDVEAMLDRWKERFGKRRFSSSADLIREDRAR
jgi:plasmid stability protein